MPENLLEFDYAELDGITLHIAKAGEEGNPLLILLHGFPEFHYGWKEQISDLVDAGYYLIIPDQRGYNKSDKPSKKSDYTIDLLSKDVIDLIKWSGYETAYLAGHDWGAAVAWYTAAHYPEIVNKVVIVNVPHTKVFGRHLSENPDQKRKSRYMLFFQIPLIPQLVLRLFNFRWLRKALIDSSLNDTFSEQDIKRYTEAWSQDRAIPCMLNWYRAAYRYREKYTYDKIHIPILIIWGKQDKFLNSDMAVESLDYCSNGDLEFIEDATHWVLKEKPDIVNELMIDFYNN